MKTGVIKRVGSNKVDVQLTGSTAVLQDVPVSSQISWDLLEDDSRVFVDFVNEKPFVLHTLGAEPNYYSPQPKTYTTVIENALLSDGSVPQTHLAPADLPQTPGIPAPPSDPCSYTLPAGFPPCTGWG